MRNHRLRRLGVVVNVPLSPCSLLTKCGGYIGEPVMGFLQVWNGPHWCLS